MQTAVTNIGSNSYLNNRPCNTILPMVNNNKIEYSLPGPSRETNTNTGSNTNLSNRLCNDILPTVNNNEIEYFLPGPSRESDRKASIETTKQLQKEFEDVLNGIGCFDGMFSLQVKSGSKPYQVPLRHMAYALQKPFKEELERLQQQDIIKPLGLDEMAK